MTNNLSLKFLRDRLRAFRAARRGNVTLIFALAVLPIVGFVGAAVDYSQANSIRTTMQAALDSTALSLSKEAAKLSSAELNQKATDYFKAVFNKPDAKNVVVTPTYSYTTTTGFSLTLAATGTVSTNFMSVMGFSNLNIGASSVVRWGNTRLRVALALDTTGSMADKNKIGALKIAAHGLLDQLQAAASKNGDVHISIIPFSKDVNVGAPNPANATWIAPNWIDWYDWDLDNGTELNLQPCTPEVGKDGWNKKKCVNSPTWVPAPHYTWNGCVTDRDQAYDVKNTPPKPLDIALKKTMGSTLFPADQFDSCPAALLPLTYDWLELHKKIDQLYPAGTTNQHIGLVWAWHSLTQDSPLFAPPLEPNYKYQQVIILMSDGMNTRNRWERNEVEIDKRMTQVCANVKAAGITVYTVLVMAGNSKVLEKCASDSQKYFIVNSTGELAMTFQQIGEAITQLRISQ
jgi:Flp pilus assembly protein TadG